MKIQTLHDKFEVVSWMCETLCSRIVRVYIYIYIYISWPTVDEGDPKTAFSITITPRCEGGPTPFPGLLHFTLDTYLVILGVKQGGNKHFLSLWYDMTWD